MEGNVRGKGGKCEEKRAGNMRGKKGGKCEGKGQERGGGKVKLLNLDFKCALKMKCVLNPNQIICV